MPLAGTTGTDSPKVTGSRSKDVVRRRTVVANIFLGVMLFAWGIGVGHYRWPPFATLWTAKLLIMDRLQPNPHTSPRGQDELLALAFTDPIGGPDLYHPPITDLTGIKEANTRVFVRREQLANAFRDMEVLGAEQLDRASALRPVVCVRYRLADTEYETFAYGSLPGECPSGKWATLVIPGSGLNQSLGITTCDLENYHKGLLESLAPLQASVYTLIKPNEDLLAWHDGNGKKLCGNFIWNWHLNRGGSYSASYLMQSIAFMKWMKSCFPHTCIAGLSQGGAATMFNALQCQPDIAMVHSGWSLTFDDAECSGPNQLIGLSGWAELATSRGLARALRGTPTHWLFSWGKNEVGNYRIEAQEGLVSTALADNPMVCSLVHEGGHEICVEGTTDWLKMVVDKIE